MSRHNTDRPFIALDDKLPTSMFDPFPFISFIEHEMFSVGEDTTFIHQIPLDDSDDILMCVHTKNQDGEVTEVQTPFGTIKQGSQRDHKRIVRVPDVDSSALNGGWAAHLHVEDWDALG